MAETEIGTLALVEDAPVTVEVDGDRFVLGVADDEPRLYSAVCPHQRGRVTVADEQTLRCPNHRWTFDPETGACTSGADASLTEVAVRQRDDKLYADLSSADD